MNTSSSTAFDPFEDPFSQNENDLSHISHNHPYTTNNINIQNDNGSFLNSSYNKNNSNNYYNENNNDSLSFADFSNFPNDQQQNDDSNNDQMNLSSTYFVSPEFSTFDSKDDSSGILSEWFGQSNKAHISTTETNDSFRLLSESFPIIEEQEKVSSLPVIPIRFSMIEQMSCYYNNTQNTPQSIDIKGFINAHPSHEFWQQIQSANDLGIDMPLYLSIKDGKMHIGELTTCLDSVTEINSLKQTQGEGSNENVGNENNTQGCRVFNIDSILDGKNDSKTINIFKYTNSKFLRPIPMLLNTKVSVSGNFCRVSITIRCNPSNLKSIENISLLMAVPPDVIGESMKVSKMGGKYDSMKRIFIWSHPSKMMMNGETFDMKVQFEILDRSSNSSSLSYRFPILVRCDAQNALLSDVDIELGSEGDGSLCPFKLELSKFYSIYQRKI